MGERESQRGGETSKREVKRLSHKQFVVGFFIALHLPLKAILLLSAFVVGQYVERKIWRRQPLEEPVLIVFVFFVLVCVCVYW